jgi:hypothetical protein
MTTQTSNTNNAKPLPFRYQFAAGAVAGISEILVMFVTLSINLQNPYNG